MKDVEIKICAPREIVSGGPASYQVQVRVEDSGVWEGESKFDFDSLDPSNPQQYGTALGAQLANPSFIRALDQAGLTRGEPIRLRLWLDSEKNAPHWVRWERVWFGIGGSQWRIATNPNVAFSRYIAVQLPDGNPPQAPIFRVLFAVANPTDLRPEMQINVEAELENLLHAFEMARDKRLQISVLAGRTSISAPLQARIRAQGWDLVPGSTTLQNISGVLHNKYHGLHILAHGDFNPQLDTGSLLLEDDSGRTAVVGDAELQSWVTPDLQLVVFQSCWSGGTPAEGHTASGLAPRLVDLGVPAVVAMQDAVTMEDARTFFSEFYRTLLDDGLVDVAVNRGRQRLIKDPTLDNWSIPVLFTRLRGGRLWNPDPLRQALLEALNNLPPAEMTSWPPIEVIEHTRGVSGFDPLQGAAGPRFALWKRMGELASTPGACGIVTGSRGCFKAAQLRRLFRDAGERFRSGLPQAPLPVLLSLWDLVDKDANSWPILRRIWRGDAQPEDVARASGRRFLFLIDAEAELVGAARQKALRAIERLRTLPGSTVVMVADEILVPALDKMAKATLLVAQPLEYGSVYSFLGSLGTDDAQKLLGNLREHGYCDLASQPRFLQHLLDLTARGESLSSRRCVLEHIASYYLARADTRRVPRGCLEDALRRIAWEIQSNEKIQLAGEDLYPILTAARAGREFGLYDLKHALVEDTRLLVPNGDEGIRFAYPVLQSYFAAHYLATAPDQDRMIGDITASLGRLGRLHQWEKVLVLLATMLPTPEGLLNSVLTGTSLMEGEQLFLAVRCYQEAVGEGKPTKSLENVVAQMVDSLIWRSQWDPGRPYLDRRKAVDSLIELALVCEPCQQEVIQHLVMLACDPVPNSQTSTQLRYDWSGIRQGAALGLSRLSEPTAKYIAAQRPDLVDPMAAWWHLREDPTAMKGLLVRDDPRLSVIAAFALSQNSEVDSNALLEAYERSNHPDVQWGIADALAGFETRWVQWNTVEPWIRLIGAKSLAACELRASHICYLIQKTNFASPQARAFLQRCLIEGSPSLQGRAIRAFGKLQDPDIEQSLRRLCEQIVQGNVEKIDPNQMRTAPEYMDDPPLQRAAFEALRDVGDAASLDVVRSARPRFPRDGEIRQLSYQVAEEIYWRLAGGENAESEALAG